MMIKKESEWASELSIQKDKQDFKVREEDQGYEAKN